MWLPYKESVPGGIFSNYVLQLLVGEQAFIVGTSEVFFPLPSGLSTKPCADYDKPLLTS